ncbi:MAG TPA: endonuclease III [Ignavibacteria bacterium]|nr:endonuclease III [Ignavibacteria bacterium]
MDIKKHALTVVKKLAQEYPDAKCHIDFKTPFELLVSTVLAAQCTDVRVNMVMVPLYNSKYKSPYDIKKSGYEIFRDEIKSINFFNNKAKSVLSICDDLINKYDGKVPDSMDDLIQHAGVGRKSASVVLGNCFGKNDVIIVDTHLKRVATRLGLIIEEDPTKIELELKKIIPDNEQFRFSMRIGEHGRQICEAKKPKCNDCFISKICPSYKTLSLK